MLGKVCNCITALMIAMLLFGVALLVGPKAIGGMSLTVLTSSMEPNIPVGSLVVVDQRATIEDLEPGDVITFTLGSIPATHRLMEIKWDEERLITKGDNNATVDGEVVFDRFMGKVVLSVPKLGKLTTTIQSAAGIPIIAGFVVVMILLIFIPEIFKKENE